MNAWFIAVPKYELEYGYDFIIDTVALVPILHYFQVLTMANWVKPLSLSCHAQERM